MKGYVIMGREIRRVAKIIAVILILGSGVLHAQTTYFVDPQGDDSQDGRSSATAWRTVQKVNSSTFNPGDRILFRCGGVWNQELTPPSSGSNGALIVFSKYGDGPNPLLDAGGTLSGWNQPANWSNQGGNVWVIGTSTFPGRIWLDGLEYGTSGDNTGRGTTTPNATYRWWHDGSGSLKVYSTGNPAATYKSIDVANQGRRAMSISGKRYLMFNNIQFRRGEVCVDVSDGDYLTFDSCQILGGTSKYGLWLRDGSDHGVARHCSFDREDSVMHTFEYGGNPDHNNGADNVALQSASYWEFDHNMFADPGHDAISLSGQVSGSTIWRSCYNSIHDNFFTTHGDYGRFTSTNAIDSAGYCAHNVYFGNHIQNMTAQSQILGMDNKLYYNVFENQRVIPWDPAKDNYRSVAIELSDYLNNVPVKNAVWNNTFKCGQASAIRVCSGQQFASIRNNLIYDMGQDPTPGNFLSNVGLVLWQGFSTDTVTNNLVYSKSGNPVIYNQTDWTTNSPVSVNTLNSMNGINGNVIEGNISADPLFNDDYTVTMQSPARDAGVCVGISADFLGNPVPSGGIPDIGAVEILSQIPTGVSRADEQHPGLYALQQNYPNPFNPSTAIRFSLSRESHVVLTVYNILGQQVAVLLDGITPAGQHEVHVTSDHLASGTYIYRLQADGQPPLVRKMTVLK
jgi:hypothetical protein